jgi:hypothetical protein
LEFIPYFKMYTEYVHNQEKSSRTLKKCANSSAVKKFFEANEMNEMSQGLDIESLLITPVQRIPRYRLLLESVLKYTPNEHPDKVLIEDCLSELDVVLNSINQAAKEAEEYFALINLEKQFREGASTHLAIFGRKLIKTGILIKEGRASEAHYTFFLFNDLLIYCHGNGTLLSLFVIHSRIPINEKFSFRDVPDKEGKSHRIAILSIQKSFIMQAQSSEDKSDWMTALQQARDSKNRISVDSDEKFNEEVAPLWEPNEASKFCSVCVEEFSLLRRRHHCRKCGKLVCAECSENSMIIKHSTMKAERVCDTCFSMSQNKIELDFTSVRHVDGINSRDLGRVSKSVHAFNDEDSGDEMVDLNLWYKAAMNYRGSSADQEMTIKKGNIVSIQFQDPSGFWFGVNLTTNEFGWVDPGMLSQISISSSMQQLDLEASLKASMQFNRGSTMKEKPKVPPKKPNYTSSKLEGRNEISYSAPSRVSSIAAQQELSKSKSMKSVNSNVISESKGLINPSKSEQFKAISFQKGNLQTEEIMLNVGDIVTIVEKHESGYWYAMNKRNGAAGWLDPIHLQPI